MTIDSRESGGTPHALPKCEPEHLTRRQAAQYIRDVLGRPFSFSTATKLAALGEFVEPAIWWGRRPLYTRDDLRRWAEVRSRLRVKDTREPTESPVSKTRGRS